MPMYRVRWEIDLEADTPRAAAELAHRYQQAPTTALCFSVSSPGMKRVDLDLTED